MASDDDKKTEATDADPASEKPAPSEKPAVRAEEEAAALDEDAAAAARAPASDPPIAPAATSKDEDEDEDEEEDEDDDEDEDEDDDAEEAVASERPRAAATPARSAEPERHDHPYREAPHDAHEHGVAHVTPLKLLVGVLGLLLVLTVITVAVTKIDLGGQWNLVVAMVIATIKAALVVTYFMHLRWDRSFNVLVFLSSVLFLILFLSFSLTDRKEYQPSIDTLEQTLQP